MTQMSLKNFGIALGFTGCLLPALACKEDATVPPTDSGKPVTVSQISSQVTIDPFSLIAPKTQHIDEAKLKLALIKTGAHVTKIDSSYKVQNSEEFRPGSLVISIDSIKVGWRDGDFTPNAIRSQGFVFAPGTKIHDVTKKVSDALSGVSSTPVATSELMVLNYHYYTIR